MKTPDVIKKGLEVCRADECHGHHTGCPYDDDFFCIMHICGDAISYIEHLEKRASLNTLRDAIYEDAVAHGLWESTDYTVNKYIDQCNRYGETVDPDETMRYWAAEVIRRETDALEVESFNAEAYADELADVIIASLSVAGKLGIDIDAAVRRKMEINKSRPWKHGKEELKNSIKKVEVKS